MEKDFDAWNAYKKKLNTLPNDLTFHEREIWWCSVGMNIGSEQDANPPDFIRPVLILKRWSPTTFWGVPLTTQLKDHPSRFRITFQEIQSDLLLDMVRAYDSKRLFRLYGRLSRSIFSNIKMYFRKIL
jgi:mRNA interferase MazF